VSSGNGFHLYWAITPTTNLELVERINAGLALMYDGDGCWDVSRVLRVPGTPNIPSRKKRKAGRINMPTALIEGFGEHTTVEALVDQVPLPPVMPQVKVGLPGTEAWVPLEEGELEQWVPYQIHTTPDDRSAADWCVVCTMLRNGASALDAARFLWNAPWGKARERGPGYVKSTIKNALSEIDYIKQIGQS
jgi:hypothetical protein